MSSSPRIFFNILMHNIPQKLFITGIGTDVGKSYSTGWLANEIASLGKAVITQKFIQTGNRDMSEDIIIHRKIMGIPFTTEDLLHITAPIIYTYPASPDLASRIDGKPLDFDVIEKATDALSSKYDIVLIEGAGGIMVPLQGNYLTIDYIADRALPIVLVSNGKLGSVSDTLLTLEAIKHRNLSLYAVIYNPWFDRDKVIAQDTRRYLKKHIKENFPDTLWIEMPEKLQI